jgi:putative heme-binding domain-containing protein
MTLNSIYPRIQTAPCALRVTIAVLSVLPFLLHAADPFADVVRKTDPLTPEQERLAFHLPPGFQVQLVASEPDIGKPMNMAFDAEGRLWLTQSREYPYAAPLDKPGRDKIKILSDFHANGHARKVTTFAEGLNIPIGLYPYKNGVIAFSIPNIYYFRDTNADGKADTKDLILGRFGFDRDVHGLTSAFRRGYDGWLYADHGFNNNTTLTAGDGSSITMNSGNCYRFKLDGSHVEQFSWGQVNPFGLMFDTLGDLWSADCHSSPVYQLLRGAYYPSFGKPHDGLGFGPDVCTHSHGSTAISGMVHYDAEDFPPEYRANTFIGNVMTCRINRDSLVEHGSTRMAKEEPDFLSSDDPWFRPVDLQLGPDGAIYVADFYNRIIGHYEVALDHPGRDRERGRIWRISYEGQTEPASARAGVKGKPAKPPATSSVLRSFDLTRASVKTLLSELSNPNITRRMLAMNQLTDRIGQPAISPLKKILHNKKAPAFQKIHGLWVLHRLNALDEKNLSAAATDKDRGVRVHAMRVLSETPAWTPAQRDLVLTDLRDSDPYVQRAAADALGQHAVSEHIQPLLDARQRVPAEDSQLLHTIRIALRNQLLTEQNLARLMEFPLPEKDSRAIADVATGVKSARTGTFLLRHIQKYSEPRDKLTTYLRQAARYAPESEMGDLAAFTRSRFADDVDFQLALFKSIEEGTSQRGATLAPALHDWGAELADRLLVSVKPETLHWRNSPIKGGNAANPWFLEKRGSSDGDKESQFISSLSPGGETLTGILRSKSFAIPPKLSFFMAGHDGSPDKPPRKKNLVRLRDASTDKVLVHTAPPRNDIAQPFSWDLSQHAGKQGYLEIVDSNAGHSYAWLAVGRFKPEVVALPSVIPNQVDKRQLAAAELAGTLRLASFEPKLDNLLTNQNANAETRAAAAKSLGQLKSGEYLATCGVIISNADEPMQLREKLATVVGEINSPQAKSILIEAFRSAPHSLQTQLALALAGNSEGAEAFLQACADGKASARLLQERPIKDKLSAAKPANLAQRLEKLTANLPAASEERQKLIDERHSAFNLAETSVIQGEQVFKQHCAICHLLDGQGALIGPQLDGVGGRGANRLMEDILDPSRNVDRAFRTSLLILKDGDVQTGLFRREEGEMLILADATGKENSVPKKDVQEKRESETSLMPDNFSEAISIDDFNNLIAYLLSKGSKPTNASK